MTGFTDVVCEPAVVTFGDVEISIDAREGLGAAGISVCDWLLICFGFCIFIEALSFNNFLSLVIYSSKLYSFYLYSFIFASFLFKS